MTLLSKSFRPSVDALVAFESAARHGSFTRAAAELNLTQGAISRQIRQLEDKLGISLFQRIRQRVVLTDAARAYLLDVRELLKDWESAVQRMAAHEGARVLNLAVLPTFTTAWLVPHLPDFSRKHPDITLNCAIRTS